MSSEHKSGSQMKGGKLTEYIAGIRETYKNRRIVENRFVLKPRTFESKKREYFQNLALQNYSVFKSHAKEGLWVKTSDGKRDWGNMSEHCLVEVARVGVIADILNFSDGTKQKLQQAAALHDIGKKRQKDLVAKVGLSFESFDKAAIELQAFISELGFDKDIAEIAGACGHEPLLATILPILEKPEAERNEVEIAQLVMFYVDNYTINSDWVTPAETTPEDQTINDQDRRNKKNENNPRYERLNEEGRKYFNGRTSYETQLATGKKIEHFIASIYEQKSGTNTNALDLPEIVDNEIRRRISKL